MNTIKLDKIKKVCKNYDKINNYTYDNSDLLTKQIINLYKEYIIEINSTECELITCQMLDKIVEYYLENNKFHNFIRKHYEDGNIDDFIIKEKIIELYDNYHNNNLMLENSTKWI